MKTRVFKVLTVISLLLCMSTAGMWAFSYRTSHFIRFIISKPTLVQMTSPQQIAIWDKLKRDKGWDGVYNYRFLAAGPSEGTLYFFQGSDGTIVTDRAVPPPRFQHGTDSSGFYMPMDRSPMILSAGVATLHEHWSGFSLFHCRLGPNADIHRLGVPLWSVCLLTMILPMIYAWQFIRSRRRTRGRGFPVSVNDPHL